MKALRGRNEVKCPVPGHGYHKPGVKCRFCRALIESTENTKERPGPFDAFETAKPNEPIFTLQGGDPLAPGLVLLWAKHARREGLRLQDQNPKSAAALELLLRATSAEEIACDMKAYQRGEASHSDQAAAYKQSREVGGTTTSENPEALEKLMRHRALRWCEERLGNADSEVTEVHTALEELGFNKDSPALLGRLLEAGDRIKGVAAEIAPTRRGFIA